ncbi:hypothetical protein [Nitrosophilus kaiyonis]|uniref:hypothetical protein n=1 Tax=Nitrosophilus kaiyonis TaxID=2930200 RepID=UPI002492290D|nr:hypothetical protein [Nitrosophilus kaiyonis]
MLKTFLFIMILFFTGCTVKKVVVSEPYIITIKSKKFRFSDYAILEKYSNKEVKIKVFNTGVLVKEIIIDDKICSDEGCLSKKEFNNLYLSKFYPPGLLKNVVLGKPIFNSENLIKKNSGFIQKIYRKNSLDIIYKVYKDSVYFKDRINKILIKIKKMKGN